MEESVSHVDQRVLVVVVVDIVVGCIGIVVVLFHPVTIIDVSASY